MSRFTDILIVSPLADGKTWVLRSEFGYEIGSEGSGDVIDVSLRFQTDFASVPRPLWWLFPKWGKYGNAAVIHDYCYWEQTRTRKTSDRIFAEAMNVLGVAAWQRLLLYWAVRLFGWTAWKKNQRVKAKGKNKVAAELPLKAVAHRTW